MITQYSNVFVRSTTNTPRIINTSLSHLINLIINWAGEIELAYGMPVVPLRYQ